MVRSPRPARHGGRSRGRRLAACARVGRDGLRWCRAAASTVKVSSGAKTARSASCPTAMAPLCGRPASAAGRGGHPADDVVEGMAAAPRLGPDRGAARAGARRCRPRRSAKSPVVEALELGGATASGRRRRSRSCRRRAPATAGRGCGLADRRAALELRWRRRGSSSALEGEVVRAGLDGEPYAVARARGAARQRVGAGEVQDVRARQPVAPGGVDHRARSRCSRRPRGREARKSRVVAAVRCGAARDHVGVLGVHDQQPVEARRSRPWPAAARPATAAGTPSTPESSRKHLKPKTPASCSGAGRRRCRAPRRPRTRRRRTAWPAAAARLTSSAGDGGGRRDAVERHVEDRGDAAGGRGAGGRGEALPLGAARLVDVHVGVHQPGQQHLVVGELDRLHRRDAGRPTVERLDPTILPSRRRPAVAPAGAGQRVAAETSASTRVTSSHSFAILRPSLAQQGCGVGDASGWVRLQVAQRVRRGDAGAPQPSAVSALRPATATTGTPARPAAWATPIGALPSRDCSSSEPSPVITRSAPSSWAANPTSSSTRSIPGRMSAPSTASAAKPTPPAARRPGRLQSSRPVASATRSAQSVQGAVQPVDVLRTGALLRSEHRRGTVRPEQRVVHVAGHHDRGLTQPGAQPDRGRRRPGRPVLPPPGGRSCPAASNSRAPSAWTMPAPPSVLALPPMPSTISPAAGVEGGRDHQSRARGSWHRAAIAADRRAAGPEPGRRGQFDHGPPAAERVPGHRRLLRSARPWAPRPREAGSSRPRRGCRRRRRRPGA